VQLRHALEDRWSRSIVVLKASRVASLSPVKPSVIRQPRSPRDSRASDVLSARAALVVGQVDHDLEGAAQVAVAVAERAVGGRDPDRLPSLRMRRKLPRTKLSPPDPRPELRYSGVSASPGGMKIR
jgi:hypothetical protein